MKTPSLVLIGISLVAGSSAFAVTTPTGWFPDFPNGGALNPGESAFATDVNFDGGPNFDITATWTGNAPSYASFHAGANTLNSTSLIDLFGSTVTYGAVFFGSDGTGALSGSIDFEYANSEDLIFSVHDLDIENLTLGFYSGGVRLDPTAWTRWDDGNGGGAFTSTFTPSATVDSTWTATSNAAGFALMIIPASAQLDRITYTGTDFWSSNNGAHFNLFRVPEPSGMVLAMLGVSLGVMRRRR